MKTWEMIKELTENPEKVFENTKQKSFGYALHCVTMNSGGDIKWCKRDGEIIGHTQLVLGEPILSDDWHEVKPKVGWDKALKHMRKHIDNKAILFHRQYRIGHGNSYIEQYSVHDDWIIAAISVEMLDSKEWELL